MELAAFIQKTKSHFHRLRRQTLWSIINNLKKVGKKTLFVRFARCKLSMPGPLIGDNFRIKNIETVSEPYVTSIKFSVSELRKVLKILTNGQLSKVI